MNKHPLAVKFRSDVAAKKQIGFLKLTASIKALDREKRLKRFAAAEELELMDGRKIKVDALKVGSLAYEVVNEMPVPVAAGEYRLKDGRTLNVGQGGAITSISKK